MSSWRDSLGSYEVRDVVVMHPLGWLLRYFLIALLGAVAADKTMGMLFEIGEPYKGLLFRGSGDDDRHCRDDT